MQCKAWFLCVAPEAFKWNIFLSHYFFWHAYNRSTLKFLYQRLLVSFWCVLQAVWKTLVFQTLFSLILHKGWDLLECRVCHCCYQKIWAASVQSFTLATSNNRDYLLQSLYYCFFTTLTVHYGCFPHIPFVVNCTFNAVLTADQNVAAP